MVRSTRRAPTRCSSAVIVRVTAGGERCRRRPAAARLPASSTATSTASSSNRSIRSSTLRKIEFCLCRLPRVWWNSQFGAHEQNLVSSRRASGPGICRRRSALRSNSRLHARPASDVFRVLAFLPIGTVDATGAPVATILSGAPGFISSPDPNTLQIAARADPADPAAELLVPGAPVGVLGIDLATRRRNRANGVVRLLSPEAMTVGVTQSFGNCPQYIQTRFWHDAGAAPGPVQKLQRLDERGAGDDRRGRHVLRRQCQWRRSRRDGRGRYQPSRRTSGLCPG